MPAFDTLQLAHDLEKAFTPEQAEVLVKALARQVVEDLATRRDVSESETAVRQDMQRIETRLEAQIRTGIADLKSEMIKWIVGAIAFNLLGTAGLMLTLIKAVPH